VFDFFSHAPNPVGILYQWLDAVFSSFGGDFEGLIVSLSAPTLERFYGHLSQVYNALLITLHHLFH
jgi:hypothetical protein